MPDPVVDQELADRLRMNLMPVDGGRGVIERNPPPGRPSAVICSLATGRHRQLLSESAPTLAAYAQRHGWSLVLSSEQLGDRPASWSKLLLVQDLLQDFEFVFWIDADALIVDLDRDVLSEIGTDADIWFARHPQDRDPDAAVLNAGVFLARSSDFTRGLLNEMWAQDQFIEHNWWENAALLDLLGYSLDPPFTKVRVSEWDGRIGRLDLAWNSVPGYCESSSPALNHHARSDHDDFALRLRAMHDDRIAVMERFPDAFRHVRSPSSAGLDAPPRRTHEFDGIQFSSQPTTDELLDILDRLDTDNETQRLRLIAAFDQLESAVSAQVAAEQEIAELQTRLAGVERELDALNNTKLLRVVRPARRLYSKVLGRIRG